MEKGNVMNSGARWASTAVAALMLAGCSAIDSHQVPDESSPLTPIPIPTVVATQVDHKVDTTATLDLLVDAYDVGGFRSATDSGYVVQGQTNDAFPRGTRVVAVRLVLDGFVPFGQTDVTGTSLANSHWDGLPDLAVIDVKEGPAFATKAGVPWMPVNAFAGSSSWLLDNHKQVDFEVAFYVPPSGYLLDLQLDVPSQSVPLTLHIPVASD
jgi:hypothetical protein